MPRIATSSRNAWKCNGSLLAMTPSKSKMMAASGMKTFQLLLAFCLHLFARAYRNLQAIFGRRIRAFPRRAVVAVRVVGAVEVHFVDAGRAAIEIHEAAGGIGFRSARQVGEGHEQAVVAFGRGRCERGELHR